MIKVSRFLKDSSPDTIFPYWEKVRYFDNIDHAYGYYNYCLSDGGGNCALTISFGAFEHTMLSHYTDDFPERMKKRRLMCDCNDITSITFEEE